MNSIRATYLEFCYILSNNHVDISCLSETKLDPESFCRFQEYKIYRFDCSKYGGGVAILVKMQLNYRFIKHQSLTSLCNTNKVELVIIELTIPSNKIANIISIYSPPKSSNVSHTNQGFWEKFFTLCTNLDNVIVTGDFNVHGNLLSNASLTPNEEGK